MDIVMSYSYSVDMGSDQMMSKENVINIFK